MSCYIEYAKLLRQCVQKNDPKYDINLLIDNYDDIMYQDLYVLAKQQKVTGMLYRLLKKYTDFKKSSFQIFFNKIEMDYKLENAFSIGLLEIACEISSYLEKKGVVHAILKGPWTRIKIYNELPIRLFADLDILIAKKNLPVLYTILERNGFICGKYDRSTNVISVREKSERRRYMLLFSHPAPYIKHSDISKSLLYGVEPHYDIAVAGKQGRRIPNLPTDLLLGYVEKTISSFGSLYGLSNVNSFIAAALSIYKDAKGMPTIRHSADCRLMKLCDLRELLHILDHADIMKICDMANEYGFVKHIKLCNEYLKIIYEEYAFEPYMKYLNNEIVNIDEYGNEDGFYDSDGGVWCQSLLERYFNPRRVELLANNKRLKKGDTQKSIL